MDPIIQSLAEEPQLIVALVGTIIGGAVVCTIVGFITTSVVKSKREEEQSRREIAAYVAEGNLSPEDAERLLQPSPWYARSAKMAGAKFWQAGPGCCRPDATPNA